MSDWIEWKGGKCPVENGALVDVMFRNGSKSFGVPAGDSVTKSPNAHQVYWDNDNNDYDIIAYRLHQPEQAAPVADGGWIKCSDRMPERLKSVWLFGSIPSISPKTFSFEGWLTGNGFVAENNGLQPGVCEKATATHWQPLPEPPKGE